MSWRRLYFLGAVSESNRMQLHSLHYENIAQYQDLAPINLLEKIETVSWEQSAGNIIVSTTLFKDSTELTFKPNDGSEVVEKYTVIELIICQSIDKEIDYIDCIFVYRGLEYAVRYSRPIGAANDPNRDRKTLQYEQKVAISEQLRDFISTFSVYGNAQVIK